MPDKRSVSAYATVASLGVALATGAADDVGGRTAWARCDPDAALASSSSVLRGGRRCRFGLICGRSGTSSCTTPSAMFRLVGPTASEDSVMAGGGGGGGGGTGRVYLRADGAPRLGAATVSRARSWAWRGVMRASGSVQVCFHDPAIHSRHPRAFPTLPAPRPSHAFLPPSTARRSLSSSTRVRKARPAHSTAPATAFRPWSRALLLLEPGRPASASLPAAPPSR